MLRLKAIPETPFFAIDKTLTAYFFLLCLIDLERIGSQKSRH
jgi:hypothetical protein